MIGLSSYVYDFAPIPIGMLAFYIIRSIKLSGRRIRIYNEDTGRKFPDSSLRQADGTYAANDFQGFIKTALIVNGKFPRRRPKSPHLLVFRELGILDSRNVMTVGKYLKISKKNKISVFSSNDGDLLREALGFSNASGFLLAYSLNSALDIEK